MMNADARASNEAAASFPSTPFSSGVPGLQRRRTVLRMIGVVLLLVAVLAALETVWMASTPMPGTSSWMLLAQSWAPFVLGAPAIAFVGVHARAGATRWFRVAAAQVLCCAFVLGLQLLVVELLPVAPQVFALDPAAWELGSLRQGGISPAALDPAAMAWFEATARELAGDMPLDLQITSPPLVLRPEYLPTPAGDMELAQAVVEVVPSEVGVWSLLALVPTYALLALAVQASLAFSDLHRRRLHEVELRGELARSQLRGLRMQMQPHFLFNTLNSVTALIGRDTGRARQMLADLSELLRSSFRDAERQEVTLREELSLLDRYVAIQSVRFGARLHLQKDVDEACLDVLVPSLCLQPIVENSIVHAVERQAAPVCVQLRAHGSGGMLLLEVVDDGSGGHVGAAHGIGLANLRVRLGQLYGERGSLVAQAAVGGFRTAVALPLRTIESEGGPSSEPKPATARRASS